MKFKHTLYTFLPGQQPQFVAKTESSGFSTLEQVENIGVCYEHRSNKMEKLHLIRQLEDIQQIFPILYPELLSRFSHKTPILCHSTFLIFGE